MNIKKIITKAENAMLQGKYLDCVSILEKLVTQDSNNVRALMLRSEAFLRLEEYTKALPDLAKVVGIDNKNLGALNNFALALLKCNKYTESRDIFEYVIEIQPKNLDARINLCNVYQALGAPEKALKLAFSAIEIDLTSAPAFNNLGTALGELTMVDEARQAYMTALDLNPAYLPTIINLAEIESKFENYSNAISLYEDALNTQKITVNDKELIKYYLSYPYLSSGRIQEGWTNYEYGLNTLLPKGAMRSKRKFIQKRWSQLGDKKSRILIWTEQGVGDEILFSSCLLDMHDLGYNVVLECDNRMINLYKRTYPKFDVRCELFTPEGFHLLNDFDLHCPMGALPGIFRNSIEAFPNIFKSMLVDEQLSLKAKELLAPLQGKKLLGICWRSGKLSLLRNLHYTSLLDWGPIFSKKDEYYFINLQYGDCERELCEAEQKFGIKIHRWSEIDLKNDMEFVFALISNLNAVVTVGTAVSTMAGSVNVETHIMMKNSWVLLGQKVIYPWFPKIKPYVAEPRSSVSELINIVAKNI